MINYGEYSVEDLPESTETCIDGIRVAFHKKDVIEAFRFCTEIKKERVFGFYSAYGIYELFRKGICYTYP